MVIETKDALLEALQKSDLLTAEQLQTARELAARVPDARNLAKLLVRDRLLTSWQGGQLLIGRVAFHVGKYKLIDLIGKGGMGKVFLARHTMMNRQVALKLISEQLSKDKAALERFLAEARTIAALDHPNIVHAYNVDNDGDRYYMVLEYAEGQDLQRIVEKEGPLDFERVASYIGQAADGLAHAHERGVIHRDIKPSNLLVNAQGTVKILDMGIARLVGAGDGENSGNGKPGEVVGTIDYMAPEQAGGDGSADPRGDIYSLGCTMYFLLTGHPPFPDGTLVERIAKHQSQEPKSVLDERPNAPKDLVKVCQKMMAKEPADRYQTAAEVAAILTQWRRPVSKVLRAVPLDEGKPAEGNGEAATDGAAATGPRAATFLQSLLKDRRRLIIVGSAAGAGLVVILSVALFLLLRNPKAEVAKQGGDGAKSAAAEPKPAKTKKTAGGPTFDLAPLGSEPTKTDATTDAAKTEAKPATKTEAKTDAKPEAKTEAKSEAKPAKTEAKPAKTETKPEAKTETKPETKTEAKPETKPEPPKPDPKPETKPPPAPAPPANPAEVMKNFPKVFDLPEIDEESASKPKPIGRVLSTIDLQLYGGTTASKTNRPFVLAREDADGKPNWVVSLQPAARAKDAEPVPVARFYVENDMLTFQWTADEENAKQANFLRNCVVEVNSGGTRSLPLRAPKQALPLTIDFVKGANETTELGSLPNLTLLHVEVTSVQYGGQATQPFTLEPKSLAVGTGSKSAQFFLLRKSKIDANTNLPVLAFDFRVTPKGQALVLELRLRKGQLAPKYDPQLMHNMLVDPINKIEQRLKGKDADRDEKLRAEANLLYEQSWVADNYAQIHKMAQVHFRVTMEIEGVSEPVVLAETQAGDGKPAGKPEPKPEGKPGAKPAAKPGGKR